MGPERNVYIFQPELPNCILHLSDRCGNKLSQRGVFEPGKSPHLLLNDNASPYGNTEFPACPSQARGISGAVLVLVRRDTGDSAQKDEGMVIP